MDNPDDFKASIISMLKHDEGFRDKPYMDTEGLLTLGFGFCLDKTPLPEKVADFWLMTILKEKSADLAASPANFIYRELNTPRKCAILNMCYQMGVSGCLEFDNMWTALSASNWDGASQEALSSRWAEQTPKRARRIAEVIRTGSLKNYWEH